MADNDDFNKYLGDDYSEADLYILLADSAGLGADDTDREQEGKNLFSRIWARRKDDVCTLPAVQAYIKDPTVSDITIIGTQIANIFIGIPGVNVAIIVALALRIGIRKLCAGT